MFRRFANRPGSRRQERTSPTTTWFLHHITSDRHDKTEYKAKVIGLTETDVAIKTIARGLLAAMIAT
jgi:hypothetical protein